MSFGDSDLFYSTRTLDPHVEESSMNRAIEKKKKKIIVEVAVML